MPHALIVGGTGLIGRAVARRLLVADWTVTLTGRDPARVPADLAEIPFHRLDRDDPLGVAHAIGDGADLLVDCACHTAVHARSLVTAAGSATSTVMMSSKAVYVDDAGNHANSEVSPRFDGPVTEQQPTMAPGSMPYDSPQGYGANKVAAERVLLDSGCPVTVLRPSKVHGEGARTPREWHFVKRALDRRPVVLLAGRGAGVDHPSAATNVAAVVQVAAEKPGRRVLNVADPDAPDGLAISRIVAGLVGHTWREVLLDDSAPAALGRHPWHRIPPIVLDTGAATALGYEPVGGYAATVEQAVHWLMSAGTNFPGSFDYAAEDDYLLTRPRG